MVKTMNKIKAPIAEELKIFEKRFREAMKSKVPLLDKITYYIVQRKGKQVRPMFVFLSAQLCGPTNDNSYTAASLIELLHTATLVVPQDTWHTARIRSHSVMMFITPGEGTVNAEEPVRGTP